MRNFTTASITLLLCALTSIARAAEPPQSGAAPSASGTTATAPASAASGTQTASPAATSASAPAAGGAASKPVVAAEAPKVVCRTEKVTGSQLRTRRVCTSPDSSDKSGDWVREQQARGAIGAGAILSGGP